MSPCGGVCSLACLLAQRVLKLSGEEAEGVGRRRASAGVTAVGGVWCAAAGVASAGVSCGGAEEAERERERERWEGGSGERKRTRVGRRWDERVEESVVREPRGEVSIHTRHVLQETSSTDAASASSLRVSPSLWTEERGAFAVLLLSFFIDVSPSRVFCPPVSCVPPCASAGAM